MEAGGDGVLRVFRARGTYQDGYGGRWWTLRPVDGDGTEWALEVMVCGALHYRFNRGREGGSGGVSHFAVRSTSPHQGALPW